MIQDLKRSGVGIVYISHRLDELAQIADRVSVLRDGQWIWTKPFAETSIDDIVAAMVGRSLDEHYPPPTRTPRDDVLLRAGAWCAGAAQGRWTSSCGAARSSALPA